MIRDKGLTALLDWVILQRQNQALELARKLPTMPHSSALVEAGRVIQLDTIEQRIIELAGGKREKEDGDDDTSGNTA